MNYKDKGFMGLVIMLLVTIAIMLLIVWKSGFFDAAKDIENTGKGTNVLQEEQQVLRRAQDMKAVLEERYR